ncbi:MAG: sugar-binding domain-containing protein [Verrucomicrobiota bacterium]
MKAASALFLALELVVSATFIGSFSNQATAAQSGHISLAGQWRFQLDRGNANLQEQWFERSLPDKIRLPGLLPAQDIGDNVAVETKWTGDIVDKSWFTAPEYAEYRKPGNLKVPFWLQPEKHYVGVAWYQRDIEIPPDWRGKRVVLTLERPHWETRVWVDGRQAGSNNSLSTPHEYDLGTALAPGKHRLTIRVDNGLVVDVGVNSHCVTDHTQGNWNGIVGDISLRATGPVWIEDVQVYPNLATRKVRIVVKLGNRSERAGTGNLLVSVSSQSQAGKALANPMPVFVSWGESGGKAEFEITPPVCQAWDEFTPDLQKLGINLMDLTDSKHWLDSRSVMFGFREVSTQGTQFLINGRKTFFRGTLECCIFPLTGHPPTDMESWKRIIRIAKAYGLNLFRFHSYCPPEAAFVAADELGFYYQVETCWANQSTTLGDGKPVDQWVYDETDRILKAYGNHPSFLLMPHGNEPGGKKASAYLAKWVNHFKAQDSRRLWTSGSGWPAIAENQFHVTPNPRVQSWGAGLKSRINARPPETRTDYRDFIQAQRMPIISHEIGEWCVYPNFDEMRKYKGYLKPRNFEIFQATLRAHRMGDLGHQFLLASGKLQTLCYKEEIESALRTPGMGGFELLDLHDFPGQGTALVGVLDPFWEDKGYVTAGEYSRFCKSTVPLARLSKRVFTTEELLEADIEVAHFGPAPLDAAATTWKLVDDHHKAVASGKLPPCDVPVDNGTALGRVRIDLKDVPSPARYKFVVTLGPAPDGAQGVSRGKRGASPAFENDWDVWVYPPAVNTQAPPGVVMVEDLNDEALAALNAGGRVLLLIPPNRVKNDKPAKVELGFSSIFWNTAWTHRQAPTTLGILCDPKHPALALFPTEYHSNWQWWYLISQAGAMILDGLPKELRPTVQVIDDWVTSRKLGLVVEARMGGGKLLVCSIDLRKDQEHNPVARQMLHSLLHYVNSSSFKPAVALSPAEVRSLMVPAH